MICESASVIINLQRILPNFGVQNWYACVSVWTTLSSVDCDSVIKFYSFYKQISNFRGLRPSFFAQIAVLVVLLLNSRQESEIIIYLEVDYAMEIVMYFVYLPLESNSFYVSFYKFVFYEVLLEFHQWNPSVINQEKFKQNIYQEALFKSQVSAQRTCSIELEKRRQVNSLMMYAECLEIVSIVGSYQVTTRYAELGVLSLDF